MRLLSAQGQRIAPAGSTYGDAVLVRIGWWRQDARATYSEMHTALASQVRISASHIRSLYQPRSLPRLACHARQHHAHVAQVAKQPGGLIVALDGLAPQGGEPQMWCSRALASGVTLRSGWLSPQDQPTVAAFLTPLKHLAWPILAVRSDKQTGLGPAVAEVLPHSRQQVCQAHSLRNLAEPLAEVDAAFQVELRQHVRAQGGAVRRQEPRGEPGHAGIFTVTGLLPTPLAAPKTPAAQSPMSLGAPTALAPQANEVLTHLFRPTHYLLRLKGRPPFRLAGMETSERLQNVVQCSLDLLAERYAPRLAHLYQGLPSALSPFTQTYQTLQQGAAWLRDMASI